MNLLVLLLPVLGSFIPTSQTTHESTELLTTSHSPKVLKFEQVKTEDGSIELYNDECDCTLNVSVNPTPLLQNTYGGSCANRPNALSTCVVYEVCLSERCRFGNFELDIAHWSVTSPNTSSNCNIPNGGVNPLGYSGECAEIAFNYCELSSSATQQHVTIEASADLIDTDTGQDLYCFVDASFTTSLVMVY